MTAIISSHNADKVSALCKPKYRRTQVDTDMALGQSQTIFRSHNKTPDRQGQLAEAGRHGESFVACTYAGRAKLPPGRFKSERNSPQLGSVQLGSIFSA